MKHLAKYHFPHHDVELIDQLRSYNMVYVATPFSKFEDGTAAAYEAACEVTGDLLRFDIKAFSPIAHSYGIAKYANIDSMDHRFWMRADKPFMEKSDALLVVQLKGWDESIGVGMEIKHFRDAGKPIHFVSPYKEHGVFEKTFHKHAITLFLLAYAFLLGIAVFGR